MAAFADWPQHDGWTVDMEVDFVDVSARRRGERLYAEAKGRTADMGLDVDTMYGQLLRQMKDPAAGQGELDLGLQARPIYHRTRDSIEAHLTIVLAALAVDRWIEAATGLSIRRFVRTARRYGTIQMQAGDHVIIAADPLPDELRDAINAIKSSPCRWPPGCSARST